MVPSSSLIRADPWICANSTSISLRSQQISRCQPSSAPSSICAAVIIRHELAAADAPADLDAFARKRVAELALAGDREVGRPAIKRRGELAGRNARPLDDRLVISGEKAVAVAKLVDAQRPEIVLEELPRGILFERHRRDGPRAHRLERVGDRRRLGRLPAGIQRAAAFEKGGKRGGVIVIRPAVEVRPVDRLVLRVGKFDRLELARSAPPCAIPATPRQMATRSKARPHAAMSFTVRLRLQQPSSWDRGRKRRARTSTRR